MGSNKIFDGLVVEARRARRSGRVIAKWLRRGNGQDETGKSSPCVRQSQTALTPHRGICGPQEQYQSLQIASAPARQEGSLICG